MTVETSAEPQPVVVTDVNISFGSMVWLLVKLALASIPAALIVVLIGALMVGVLRGIG